MPVAAPDLQACSSASSTNFSGALVKLEIALCYAYVLSLPLSITASWAIFIAGISVRAILFAASPRIRAETLTAFGQAPLLIPLLVFAFAVSISGGLGSLMQAWSSLSTLKNLLPYVWAAVVLRPLPQHIRGALLLLLSISAVAGVWGTIQQIFNIHPGYKYLQGTGFLAGPMAFAGQMQLFSLLSLAFFMTGAHKFPGSNRPDVGTQGCIKVSSSAHKATDGFALLQAAVSNRFAFGFLVACNYLGVLFAGERSAWLGALVATMLLLVLHFRRIPLNMVLGLLVAGVLTASTVPLVKTRLSAMFSGNDVSITARQTIWGECLRLIPKSPWLGVGIRNFPHFDIPEAIVPGVSKDLNHAHSNYFHLLTTTGFLGSFAFMYLNAAFLYSAKKRLDESRRQNDALKGALALGLGCAVVSLMISGIFEYNFGTAQVRLAQWFLLGLL